MNYYAQKKDGQMICCSTKQEAQGHLLLTREIFEHHKINPYKKLYYWHKASISDVEGPSPAKPKQALRDYAIQQGVDPEDLEIRLPHEHGGSPDVAWVGIKAPVLRLEPDNDS